MIDNISLNISSSLGDIVPLPKITNAQLEIKIEVATADVFSEICRRNNSIRDEEIKVADKFYFLVNLNNYLEEMKNNANTN